MYFQNLIIIHFIEYNQPSRMDPVARLVPPVVMSVHVPFAFDALQRVELRITVGEELN